MDFAELTACAQPPACAATASFDDGGGELTLTGLECLLTALKDRTPGAYTLGRTTEDGGGSGSHQDVLIVAEDGKVIHASKHRVYVATTDPPTDIDETTPVQSCELKPSSYFQSCLDAIAADPQGSAAAECAQVYAVWDPTPLPFFESCTETSYECSATDLQHLLACSALDLTAGVPEDAKDQAGIAQVRELLIALRDRTPGSYSYHTTKDVTYAWGAEARVFISQADPDYVLTAADGAYSSEAETTPYSKDAERCKLQPASYFQDCIDELDVGDLGFNKPACLHYGETQEYPWFENCEQAAAVCE